MTQNLKRNQWLIFLFQAWIMAYYAYHTLPHQKAFSKVYHMFSSEAAVSEW